MVGQSAVTKLLTQSCTKDFFHHAYLMAGHSGSGKTTAARILAMVVNCVDRKPGEAHPCGKCHACTLIQEGSSIDVRELDGATDGGKEEIKRIVESSLFDPSELKKKVFIIDEAHELSSAAISSLLKPTEEPNSNVMYILCTSEYAKIPVAIASRCMRLNFAPLSTDVIAGYLHRLCAYLKRECTMDACNQIACISNGNMRYALNYLQSMMVNVDGEIDGDSAREFLGLIGREDLYDLAFAIAKGKAGTALDILESFLVTSPDVVTMLYHLSEIFRNSMLVRNGATVATKISNVEQQKIKDLAGELGDEVDHFVEAFTECYRQISLNSNKKWVLQSLVSILCRKAV